MRRKQDLAAFRELQSMNVSSEVLAMGLSLLQQTWQQTNATKEWSAMEQKLLSEVDLLDQFYADLSERSLRIEAS